MPVACHCSDPATLGRRPGVADWLMADGGMPCRRLGRSPTLSIRSDGAAPLPQLRHARRTAPLSGATTLPRGRRWWEFWERGAAMGAVVGAGCSENSYHRTTPAGGVIKPPDSVGGGGSWQGCREGSETGTTSACICGTELCDAPTAPSEVVSRCVLWTLIVPCQAVAAG